MEKRESWRDRKEGEERDKDRHQKLSLILLKTLQ